MNINSYIEESISSKKKILENKTITATIQKISDIIMQEAIDNGYGIAKDDMTVIVAKLEKI